MTAELRVDGSRLWGSIMAMAKIGPGQHGGSSRLALTDADRAGRDLFVDWCREIGCSVVIDAFSVPSQSGTGAGASRSSAPSATSNPTAAWVIDLAMLHELSVDSASIAISGWNAFAGCVP